ncbi:MAG: threonine--tRNA ligase [Nanoarchaeota archaeon]
MKIHITFPDKSRKQFDKEVTGFEVLKELPQRLHKEALAMKLNEQSFDLSHEIEEDCHIQFLFWKDAEGKDILRHSAAHILSQAVKRLHPEAKPTIGPAIEEGFYYDFDNLKITQDDLPKIEAEMHKIIQEKLVLKRQVMESQKALLLFVNEKYKKELIEEMPDKFVSIYQQGNYIDLCRGPHVPDTGYVKAVKLTKLAGAYWRGDSKNPMLTRIYGVAFPSQQELLDYLKQLEEAERRDHKKIGKDMDLFSFHEESAGVPFLHPKGAFIYTALMNFLREEYQKRGYGEVITPNMYNNRLWHQSGHWDHYKDDMYFTKVESQEYGLKPMNCPAGILIYKSQTRSYRDLPIRYADFGFLHRNELSGVLNGLLRVRRFVQDDSHNFVMPDQIEDEIEQLVDFIKFLYEDTFGFAYEVLLSTKPDKAMGDPTLWETAEKALENAMRKLKMHYTLAAKEGAFYGPKLDFIIKDALGRNWQCGTIQLDFQMPERFDLNYEGKDGSKHRPVIIHRALIGSFERFIAVLLEHTAGRLPLWLSPVQIRIMPIAERHNTYCEKLHKEYLENSLRSEIDERADTVNKKVRDAQLEKIPLMLTIGDKEVEKKTVSVRTLDGKVHFGLSQKHFIETVRKLVEKREREIKLS